MGENGAAISKQRLSDEFLTGFRAYEETLKVKHTAVCLETDVDTSRSTVLKKLENNVGARTHPCLTPSEMGNLPDSDPVCFT